MKQRIEKLKTGVDYIAATYIDSKSNLSGLWDVYFKIDGVRYITDNQGGFTTRGGGKLRQSVHDVVRSDIVDFELYRHDHGTSMSLKAGTLEACESDVYSLFPTVDERLHVAMQTPMTMEYAYELMYWAISHGYEGIVLRQGYSWMKAVPTETADVVVTGWIEGKKKGTVGSLTTPFGRVSGFTDEWKTWLYNNRVWMVGKVIEASYRNVTKHGKMRYAQFERMRLDKSESEQNVPNITN